MKTLYEKGSNKLLLELVKYDNYFILLLYKYRDNELLSDIIKRGKYLWFEKKIYIYIYINQIIC